MPAANPTLYFARLKRLARNRGGVVLSQAYRSDVVKLRFRCAEGHEWMASPGKIYMGRWCPTCGRSRRDALHRAPAEAKLRRIVAEKGGALLSPRYVNSSTHHRFRCRHGHEWETVPNSIAVGRWCPYCARIRNTKALIKRTHPVVIQRMQWIARKHRGMAIAGSYRGSRDRMTFRCAEGHEFKALPSSIDTGLWCPDCDDDERLARARLAAVAHGGTCLSTKCRSNEEVLEWQCLLGHRWRSAAETVFQGHWCPKCMRSPRYTIEECRRVARERGGECLSARYVTAATPVRWRCREGHFWRARPGTVMGGSWCRRCNRGFGRSRALLSLEVMREMAAEHLGRCLSQHYRGIYDRLRWRCAKGHEWETPANNVRRGGWCPKCARAHRTSLPAMREFAAKLGGACLTRTWLDRSQPLTFRCERGHRFAERPIYVQAGVWCPVCKPRPVASR